LTSTLFALVKGAIVFAVTLALSWLTVLAVQRMPFGPLLFATPPRAIAKADPSAQSSPGLYARARPFDSP
jgi:hypothetical protein